MTYGRPARPTSQLPIKHGRGILFLSQPSRFSSIDGLGKNRQDHGTSGERENGDCRDDLGDVFQMPLDLLPLVPCPFFIRVPGFHKKMHQSLYRKDFHEDGVLVHKDQPFEIFLDHRSVFLPPPFPLFRNPNGENLRQTNFPRALFKGHPVGLRPKLRLSSSYEFVSYFHRDIGLRGALHIDLDVLHGLP